MKNRLMYLFLGVGLTLLIPAMASAQANKVDVCHVTGNGAYLLINVAARALPAHLAHGDVIPGEGLTANCLPVVNPVVLLEGIVPAVSSSTNTLANVAGAEWSVILNGDGSVTSCLAPTLSVGSPYLQALTVGITNEYAGNDSAVATFQLDLTYGSSDGTPFVDELVSTDGGVTYCSTVPAGQLPSGDLGIFFMVNQRSSNNATDLQRFIGLTAMTTANNWGGFDFSWNNRFKITLP